MVGDDTNVCGPGLVDCSVFLKIGEASAMLDRLLVLPLLLPLLAFGVLLTKVVSPVLVEVEEGGVASDRELSFSGLGGEVVSSVFFCGIVRGEGFAGACRGLGIKGGGCLAAGLGGFLLMIFK